MNTMPTTSTTRSLWASTLRRLALLGLGLAAAAASALTLTPSTVSVSAGGTATVAVTGATGTIRAASRNTGVATGSLSNATPGSATLTVRGVAAGTTQITVRDRKSRLQLPVTVTASTPMTVSPTSLSLAVASTGAINVSGNVGTITAGSSNTAAVTTSVNGNVVSVRAVAVGSAVVSVSDSRSTIGVPVTVTGSGTVGNYALLAWNDLGMHCVDGKDYSVFSILPPFNNLHAQLVNASTGKAVTSGVTLSYEAVVDPAGSINTTSAGKTNFWDWSMKLYGASPARDVGLTGNATPSLTARPMVLDPTNGWYEATGLPITPYDDAGSKNFYPTVKVSARDATGKLLASSVAVLPVSDEMTCMACHATPAPGETNTARLAAKPAAGWVNVGDPEKDWKLNILRLHDEMQANDPRFLAALQTKGLAPGLYASALAGNPTLCAGCHASNALPGTGISGISSLTSAQHANHAKVIDPVTMLALNNIDNRSACYMCHPGSVTKCLRGAMGNATDADGNATMGCQSCHGTMSMVGSPARTGWLEQPNCQACHFNGKRTTNALDASGKVVVPADQRFATNPNTPSAGFSLFRFSKGHGGMQCESCHGATHAEYPSSHVNDNLQSIALQGYEGTVRECKVCHSSLATSTSGGPHGMHSIGQGWVNAHGDRVESGGTAACAYCHGSDYRGSPLGQVKIAKTFSTEHGSRSYAPGQVVSCYDCHNGPRP